MTTVGDSIHRAVETQARALREAVNNSNTSGAQVVSSNPRHMPKQTINYILHPRRWAVDRYWLLVGGFAELVAILLLTHYYVPHLSAGTSILVLMIPVVIAVYRPGVGVILAIGATVAFNFLVPDFYAHALDTIIALLLWVVFTFVVAVVTSHYQDSLRLIYNRILDAEGEERRRIANDLHDDTIQVVVAALLRLDMVPEETKHTKNYSIAVQSLRDALERLRRLTFQLRPPQLQKEGLAVAVVDLCREMEIAFDEQNMDLECRVAPNVGRYPPMVEELCHRVILEALVNSLKHSRARHVRVGVEQKGDRLCASITDDGRGFTPEGRIIRRLDHEKLLHLGLTAKVERAEWMGGTLQIRSSPGQGTSIELRVPTAVENGLVH